MRKPRDYDAELKALTKRANDLKCRKIQQLGELVMASEADALPIEVLAGVLVTAANEKDGGVREGWRKAGASFFQRTRRASGGARPDRTSAAPNGDGSLPSNSGASAA